MHIFWDFTRHCNLSCVHCYNAPDRASGPDDATLELQLETVTNLAKKYPQAVLHFLGGEPLVSPNFEQVFGHAMQKGFRTEVTTNGTVITKSKMKLLTNDSSIVHLSLDSINEERNDAIRGSGVFKRVTRFLKEWNSFDTGSRKAALNLSFTLTRSTLDEAADLVEFCLLHQIPRLTISPIKILGSAETTKENMSVTARDYIAFVSTLAKRALGEDMRIRATGGSKRFANYIKWNYYSNIVDVEPACDSSVGQLRLSWDCKLAPCIMGAKAAPLFAEEWSIRPNEKQGVERILSTTSFQSFAKNAHRASLTREPSICSDCDHFRDRTCYAGCPIQKEYGPARLCEALTDL